MFTPEQEWRHRRTHQKDPRGSRTMVVNSELERRARKGRFTRGVIGAGVVAIAAAAVGTGTAMAGSDDRTSKPVSKPVSKAKESHVTGDAWVKFPGDPETPYRRFIVDVHGGPWKIVDGKMEWGAARGTIRFNHFAPDKPGGPSKDHWGSIKVDYVMAGGPVAVVSGIRQDGVDANQKRGTLTFYQSPLGHKHDRMGFSWGIVNPQCQQMGTGPAPFSPASAGPDGRWLKGYTVKDGGIPLPDDPNVQPPENPPNCKFKKIY
ncbi:hypothetical protein [Spirillospora sp. CA-294931]|uniref:hypothetical protein n=1 Tax=Spirillospora sp. CA-294931 TaxID=3240042 RepID=UPI003D8E724A